MGDLNRLHDMRSLDRSEAQAIMNDMISGAMSEVKLSATLASLNHRELQLDEVLGFRDAMIEHCQRVDLGGAACMDFCGTGGDGKDTFNISTTTAFLLGAMGVPVVKHGNYGVSSSCGSSNVLEALGYVFPKTADGARRRFEAHGTVFLHAPFFHPAMRNVAPVRKALGVRTLFNIMGPLSNPALPTHQITGTFDLRTQRLYAWTLERMGMAASVVHSLDGYDELSLTSDARVYSTRKHFHTVSAADFGLGVLEADALLGADTLEANGAILVGVLKGEGTPAQQQVVAANAAMALTVWDPEEELGSACRKAQDFLASGRAYDHLQSLLS